MAAWTWRACIRRPRTCIATLRRGCSTRCAWDDHAKNFAFLHDEGRWRLAPAYDLTFSHFQGAASEHTTAFAGAGTPSRAALRKVCQPFAFLDVDGYIERTLEALSGWDGQCRELEIAPREAREVADAQARVRRGP
ncbi:HipA domain-containing protein [Pseudoxanthomonas broegbernensis]|uniref:HipA domain-containing protein n=1 Tax=Pseudoxanthomonas broegbernensis TaxID=83619 RepID=UPI001825E6B0|nr:HipA domain-containing protein [Pseudoxanthomonas broegbernensis]MBB6066324.1 hypothetical protein [Pseudoxanthomonas broegbernensis]